MAAGVVAGLVILLMSVTGVLLTYERQLIAWSDRAFVSAPPSADAQRLPIASLLERAREQRDGERPTNILLKADRDAPVTIAFGQATVFADAYSGALIGAPTTGMRRFMSELRVWHRYIAIDGANRPITKAITGWSNLLFLFIVLSGMYLWIPRVWGWTQVKAVALFRGGLTGKARDFNWHNVIGIWSAVPLAIVVATAMPISFPWANALVYRMVGEDVPAPAGPPRGAGPQRESANAEPPAPPALPGLEARWARAESQVEGWRSISLRVPATDGAPLVFLIDRGDGGQPQLRDTLTLDGATGAVVAWEPFTSLSTGRQLRSWSRFTHTGEAFGLVGQTIAGLVSAGGVVLVWTGLALALRRFVAWWGRSRRPAESYPPPNRSQRPVPAGPLPVRSDATSTAQATRSFTQSGVSR